MTLIRLMRDVQVQGTTIAAGEICRMSGTIRDPLGGVEPMYKAEHRWSGLTFIVAVEHAEVISPLSARTHTVDPAIHPLLAQLARGVALYGFGTVAALWAMFTMWYWAPVLMDGVVKFYLGR